MVTEDTYPVDGRIVHILANEGCDIAGVRAVKTELLAAGVIPQVIATHKGAISGGARGRDSIVVDRSFHTARSVEADAVIVAGGVALADNPLAMTYVQSAYRHYKPIAAWGDGEALLSSSGIESGAPGVVVSDKPNRAFAGDVLASLAVHRHWERATTHPTRMLTGEVG
jgi:catalase